MLPRLIHLSRLHYRHRLINLWKTIPHPLHLTLINQRRRHLIKQTIIHRLLTLKRPRLMLHSDLLLEGLLDAGVEF